MNNIQIPDLSVSILQVVGEAKTDTDTTMAPYQKTEMTPAPRNKILIVDDRPENLLALEQTLSSEDIATIKAASGEEALRLLHAHDIALVILDVNMPGMNGYETADLMKKQSRSRHIPIIFVTAISEERQLTVKGYETGAVDYLFKPLAPEILRAKVDVFIRLHRKNRILKNTVNKLSREIAERKKSEETIKVLAKFPDENPNPVMRVSSRGEVVYMNTASVPLYMFWENKLSKERKQYWTTAIKECLARRENIRIEECIDGKIFLLSAIPVSDMECVYIYGEDISEQRNYEKQLKLLASVFNNSIEGIAITDRHGNIEQVNPAFTTITGYPREEVVGKNPRILKSNHQPDDFYKTMWDDLTTKGFWQGEIWNRRKNGDAYPEWLSITNITDVNGRTSHYLSVFHDITDLKLSEDKLKYQANHDALTKLPNRLLFSDRLEKAIAYANKASEPLGLLFLDLDNFKNINDSFGHHIGDRFLMQVARKLKEICRQEETIARFGGDEFIIIVHCENGECNVAARAQEIIDSFMEPVTVGKYEFILGASVGIALYPHDGTDADTLIKNADLALNNAKKSGKNNYAMYTASMDERVKRRTALEFSLRKALEQNQFEVLYQPKVEAVSEKVTGVEALIRWRRSENELVSPVEFIPLAEDTGLILDIGKWVLETACRTTKKWHDSGFDHLTVAVNISAKQFQDEHLFEIIGDILIKTGLPPHCLNLEITENIIMGDVRNTIETLRQFTDLGIKISVDDFGTGYSSLSYLKKFPVDIIKIDRSFVKDIPENDDDMAISKAVIQMAHSMGLKVVAEGVENPAQLEFMRTHHCEEIQGYYYSRPLTAEDMGCYLRKMRCEVPSAGHIACH